MNGGKPVYCRAINVPCEDNCRCAETSTFRQAPPFASLPPFLRRSISDRISALVDRAPQISAEEFAKEALPLLMEADNDLVLVSNWHDRAEQGWADENDRANRAEASLVAHREALSHLIDAAVTRWHDESDAQWKLHDWLELNMEQYAMYVECRWDDLAAALAVDGREEERQDLEDEQGREMERYWRHNRIGSYTFARLLCAIFGHTDNVREGGDCRRCWGP